MSCPKAARHSRYSNLLALPASSLLRRLERYQMLDRLVAERLRSAGLVLAENEGDSSDNDVARFCSTLVLQSCLKGRISLAKKTLHERFQHIHTPSGAIASIRSLADLPVPTSSCREAI